MFERVRLEMFRGIRICEKPIELSKFTVLIGPNNSGKTSLLNALFLLPIPWTVKSLSIIDEHKLNILETLGVKSFVYRYAGVSIINCVVEGKTLEVKVGPEGQADIRVSGKRIVNMEKMTDIFKRDEEELVNYTVLIPNSDRFIERLINKEVKHWDSIEATGAHARVVKRFIVKVVEDRFTEAIVKFNRLAVRKEFNGDAAYIYIDDLGDGVKRFLVSALWLEALKPKVVLWDDLEASAHPMLVRALLKWLTDHNWQVIISTHSIDVLKEVTKLDLEDIKVISLKKSYDDVLSYREYTVDDVREMIDKGVDPRKLIEW